MLHFKVMAGFANAISHISLKRNSKGTVTNRRGERDVRDTMITLL